MQKRLWYRGHPEQHLLLRGSAAPLIKLGMPAGGWGGFAKGGSDDMNAIGKGEVVLPVVMGFQQDLSDRWGLLMQQDKLDGSPRMASSLLMHQWS